MIAQKREIIENLDRLLAVVIGTSLGGVKALGKILPFLPRDYPLPVIVVLHISEDQPSMLTEIFRLECALRVKDAQTGESILPGTIYFAPPGFHLRVEDSWSFSLVQGTRVQFSRPSIDVLFESAAFVFGRHLVGVLLTGANEDGAAGLRKISNLGGLVLVQNLESAQARAMPESGIRAACVPREQVLSLKEITHLLLSLKGDTEALLAASSALGFNFESNGEKI